MLWLGLGLKTYYDLAGARGALAGARGALSIAGLRLFGRPKEVTVWPLSFRKPLALRMETTDLDVYRDVIGGQFEFRLPFEPRVIVDAGAHIGLTSIWFANKYPAARIVAIEPEPSNFDVLARNVRPYPLIVPVHAALWSHDGEIAVSNPNPAQENWAFVTCEGGDGVRVRAATITTLKAELSLPAIDLIKVNIEGAEQEVFEDVGWLEGVRCVMIDLHEWLRPGCSAIVERALKGFERSQKGAITFFLRPEELE
jgi:FkbM family methyltransferase